MSGFLGFLCKVQRGHPDYLSIASIPVTVKADLIKHPVIDQQGSKVNYIIITITNIAVLKSCRSISLLTSSHISFL